MSSFWSVFLSSDLTNLAYQPATKSREQSGHPKRHITFAMSERRPASPAHTPDMDEDKDEDDKPLVRPSSKKELAREKSCVDTHNEDLLPMVSSKTAASCTSAEKKERTPSMTGPSCYTGA